MGWSNFNEKYYLLPNEEDGLEMPLIKTPCILTNLDEIDLTYSTMEDAKIEQCPECGGDVISSTLTPPRCDVSHWVCLCGHRWDTDRGIVFHLQLKMF